MQVIYDHQIFAQQRFGGISRYFAELATRLPACGDFDVRVIAPVHQNAYLDRQRVPGLVSMARLQPGRIGIKRALRWANALALPFAWRGRNPDIVHETFFSSRPVGHGRRRILTVYDMIHELHPQPLAQAERVMAAKRAAIARADHMICISECTRRDLVRLLAVEPARTSVVYLGHSLGADASQAADTTPASGARPVLLYVGDRGSYKNFSTLAEAFAQSARLRADFDLVAFGGRPFQPRELQGLQRLGIADCVRHASGDDQELAGWYRRAHLYVCPSTYEGFGLPSLEAMAHGCAVVCSDRGSLPEVVGEAGEYFDPLDAGDMATTIERVACNDARRAELQRLGAARAARFSWAQCAADTAEVYRQLA